MATNRDILDAMLRRQVYLQRYTTGEVKAILALLEDADAELAMRIRSNAHRIGPGGLATVRAKEMLTAIRALRAEALREVRRRLRDEMHALARVEAKAAIEILRDTIPVNLDLITPPAQTLRALVTSQPFAAHRPGMRTLKQAVGDIAAADIRRIESALQLGIVQGETPDQLVRRIVGRRANKYADGLVSITRRDAEAVTRAAVNHVSNAAREEVFSANQDIILGLRVVATLDGKTCITAGHKIALSDGRMLPIEDVRCGMMVIGGLTGLPRAVVGTRSVARRETITVRFVDGRSVRCTPDHLFLAESGWVEAKDLHGCRVFTVVSEPEEIRGSGPRFSEAPVPARERSVASGSRDTQVRDRERDDSLHGGVQHPQGGVRHGEGVDRYAQYDRSARVQPDGGRRGGPEGVEGEERGGKGSLEAQLLVRPGAAEGSQGQGGRTSAATIGGHEGTLERRVRREDASVSGVAGVQGEVGRGCKETHDRREAQGDVGEDEGALAGPCIQGKNAEGARYAAVQSQDVGAQQEAVRGPGVLRQVASGVRQRDDWQRGEQESESLAVEAVERAGVATVFDIEVEVDHSFVCEGVIVHNSRVCSVLDGAVDPIGNHKLPKGERQLEPKGARPGFHPWGCRSIMAPILSWDGIADRVGERPFVRDTRDRRMREKDFRAEAKAAAGDDWRGMDRAERTSAVRRRRDGWVREAVGTVPAKTEYRDWFARQPQDFQREVLGEKHFKLYRDGGLKLDRFVDRGRPLTLEQLEEREPEAWKDAGL